MPLTILLAEDDEGHATLVRRNLERAGILNNIVWVENGREALDYVHCKDAHVGRGEALVVLLDINMPVMDGIETLRQLKTDERTRRIPVMMLTTADDPREIERCYELGCSVYLTKPVEYEKFREAVRQLGMFLQFVQVPARQRDE